MNVYELGNLPNNFFNNFEKNNIELVKALKKKKNSNLDQSTLLMFGKVKNEDTTEKKYFLLKYETSSNQLTEYNLFNHKDDLIFDLFFDAEPSPCFVITFGTYSGELFTKSFFRFGSEEFIEKKSDKKIHNYKITTLKMNALKMNESIIIASGSNDRRVTISSMRNFNNAEEIKIEILYSFT